MLKLNRRALMATLAGAAAVVPGAALANEASRLDLNDQLHNLIAELRSKEPPEDLWRYIDHRGELAPWLAWNQKVTMEMIADRLERLIGGAS